MLTRIRNAQFSRKTFVEVFFSKIKRNIIDVLKKEGYIKNFEIQNKGKIDVLKIRLKYFRRKPVIEKIIRISRPGLRIYKKREDLSDVMNGLGISIISTSYGIMTNKDAKKMKLGGEVICEVY
ncbi:SSU ribosomal protein S8p (S15Ae) [Candidatus Riesia pediculischaeffi PTSU]|nr:SSU ribosomal protein S8p (S15Ae) [Candidatus Riesia pediculischaeffi PTSU]